MSMVLFSNVYIFLFNRCVLFRSELVHSEFLCILVEYNSCFSGWHRKFSTVLRRSDVTYDSPGYLASFIREQIEEFKSKECFTMVIIFSPVKSMK
jgi:hypothetical protein